MAIPTLIPAATLLLVRDNPELQVLMVERHHKVDFVAGALVFPGGKTNQDDQHQEWQEWADGAVGLSAEERAARITAVRESFEESGVLLARARTDRGVGAPLAPAIASGAIQSLRPAIDRGEESFLKVLQGAGLVLALDAVIPFAHWITPLGMPKRFDTLFFIAVAPVDQIAACDGREAVEAIWISPHAALDAAAARQRQIVFPTRLNLSLLAQSSTAQEACHAAAQRKIATVLPEIVAEEGETYLQIPAESGYGAIKIKLVDA